MRSNYFLFLSKNIWLDVQVTLTVTEDLEAVDIFASDYVLPHCCFAQANTGCQG